MATLVESSIVVSPEKAGITAQRVQVDALVQEVLDDHVTSSQVTKLAELMDELGVAKLTGMLPKETLSALTRFSQWKTSTGAYVAMMADLALDKYHDAAWATLYISNTTDEEMAHRHLTPVMCQTHAMEKILGNLRGKERSEFIRTSMELGLIPFWQRGDALLVEHNARIAALDYKYREDEIVASFEAQEFAKMRDRRPSPTVAVLPIAAITATSPEPSNRATSIHEERSIAKPVVGLAASALMQAETIAPVVMAVATTTTTTAVLTSLPATAAYHAIGSNPVIPIATAATASAIISPSVSMEPITSNVLPTIPAALTPSIPLSVISSFPLVAVLQPSQTSETSINPVSAIAPSVKITSSVTPTAISSVAANPTPVVAPSIIAESSRTLTAASTPTSPSTTPTSEAVSKNKSAMPVADKNPLSDMIKEVSESPDVSSVGKTESRTATSSKNSTSGAASESVSKATADAPSATGTEKSIIDQTSDGVSETLKKLAKKNGALSADISSDTTLANKSEAAATRAGSAKSTTDSQNRSADFSSDQSSQGKTISERGENMSGSGSGAPVHHSPTVASSGKFSFTASTSSPAIATAGSRPKRYSFFTAKFRNPVSAIRKLHFDITHRMSVRPVFLKAIGERATVFIGAASHALKHIKATCARTWLGIVKSPIGHKIFVQRHSWGMLMPKRRLKVAKVNVVSFKR